MLEEVASEAAAVMREVASMGVVVTAVGAAAVGTITVQGPWCKCKEETGSYLTKRSLYANLGYKCNKYVHKP